VPLPAIFPGIPIRVLEPEYLTTGRPSEPSVATCYHNIKVTILIDIRMQDIVRITSGMFPD
jgi:hypothetical protein